MTEQLTLPLDAAPVHRPGRDLDLVRHQLQRAQQRALDQALRAASRPEPCHCLRPMPDAGACLKCRRTRP